MPPPTHTTSPDLSKALQHVECLPLGQGMIAHNRESGAIVATNAFGAMLIDHLRQTTDAGAAGLSIAAALDLSEEDVRGAVEATMARWQADGLFLTALRPFPGAIPYRPAQGGVTRRLGLGSRTVALHSEDAALVGDLDKALAPMELTTDQAIEGAGTCGHPVRLDVVRLDVVRQDEGYGVFRDGAPIWGLAEYELTRFHLLREIMDVLCGPERVAAHLHASAMAKDGAGLVFAGASGSGKSTLATALLGAGAALAADDHVAIDTGGDALLAFPTRPNLKPGTAEVPAVRAVITTLGEGRRENGGAGGDPDGDADGGVGGSRGPFVPKARVPVGTGVRLAGFVFPRYAPDADNALTAISPDEALRTLIQTGSRVSRSTRSIAPLVHALGTCPSCQLTYRDTDFAIAACLKLFES